MLKKLIKKILGRKILNSIHSSVRFIKGAYYSLGDNVECPICNNTYMKFLSFCGRKNVWCPHCKSLERHRLLYLFLKDRMKIFSSDINLLHFAPEICFYREFKKHININYKTANLMVSFVDEIEVHPDFIMSVTDIKFDDNSFDVVLCNQVLEHVQDDKKAMKEIYRVLKKGGYAILQVPVNIYSQVTLEDPNLTPEEREQYYGFADHLRYYGLDYKDRLEINGFTVYCDNYVEQLNIDRYALDKNEKIYLCYKE